MGLSPPDVLHVEWLVKDHLRLYHWAMRRDTSDPKTMREIAEVIGTTERLRDLYLLTLVDLGTTNPTALTTWKSRVLDDLHRAAADAIEAAASGAPTPSRAAQLRADASVALGGARDRDDVLQFLAGMPDRYVLTHGTELVREHAAIARARGGRVVHVAAGLRPSPGEGELVVVTEDRPGLLADIAAVLAGNRLAVTTAHIYTRAPLEGQSGKAEAFDVFHVRHPGLQDGDPLDHATLGRVERDLAGLLGGTVPLADLLARKAMAPAWASRKSPDVRTEVLVDNEVSPRFTVIDVFTRDRFGLLHAIARALHEQHLTISLSKVSTEGERVADVFYVQNDSGGQLKDPVRVEAVRQALFQAIESLASAATALVHATS